MNKECKDIFRTAANLTPAATFHDGRRFEHMVNDNGQLVYYEIVTGFTYGELEFDYLRRSSSMNRPSFVWFLKRLWLAPFVWWFWDYVVGMLTNVKL